MAGPENRTDEELIRLYRQGDRQAADVLLEKYKKLVRMRARTLYLAGGDRDDLLQEGMLGLFKAIRYFDPDRNSLFRTYASLCVDRQIYSAIRHDRRKKNQPLNTSLSIHALTESAGVPEEWSHREDPESMLLDQEALEQLKKRISESLSSYENQVLDLYLEGNSFREIADGLNKTPKSVENAWSRIRRKIRNLQTEAERKDV